jgi:site-specific DNA-methyltransferase (adenine-specific)
MTVKYLGQKEVPIYDLKPHPDNPNRGDVNSIAESLEEFGQYRSIVATQDMTVLAGHHVLQAAKNIGLKKIRIEQVQCSDAEAKRMMLADNRLADLGMGADLEQLLEVLQNLDGDLAGTGFDDEYIRMLEEQVGGPPSLDDLEDEAGEGDASDFYRRLTLLLDPRMVTAWEAHRKQFPDDNEAFADLLNIAAGDLADDSEGVG